MLRVHLRQVCVEQLQTDHMLNLFQRLLCPQLEHLTLTILAAANIASGLRASDLYMKFRSHNPLRSLVNHLPRHEVWVMVETWHYEGLILGYFGGHYR